MSTLALIISILASAATVTTGLVKAAQALWAFAVAARDVVERLDHCLQLLEQLSTQQHPAKTP